MKILILNGSPRTKGLISRMLGIMAEEARARGAEVEEVQISKLQIRPCTGCMSCRDSEACVLPEDDAQRTLQKIQWADVLIIGSPCYWGNLNGYLKVLFDRMVYGMMGENSWGMPLPMHKGKRAVIVSTCSTPWPFNLWFNQTRGVVKALREILKWSGFSIKGVIQKGGTKQHPELKEKDVARCKRIIRKL
ncbi:flavodoxin family protein [Phocaeicola sp.]